MTKVPKREKKKRSAADTVTSPAASGPAGSHFEGSPLLTQSDLAASKWDAVLITSLDDLNEMEEWLRDLDVPEKKVWRLA